MVRTNEDTTRVFLCIGIGASVALVNSFLDALFYRRSLVSGAILLNDCVIGAVVSMLVYGSVSWLARRQEEAGVLKLMEGLDEILSAIIEQLGADKGNIQLLDKSTNVLTIALHRGFHQPFLDFFREVSARDDSACGRALRSGRAVVIEDIEADAPYAPFRSVARAAGYRAVVSAPITGSDARPLGVISAHFAAVHRPTDRELHALEVYARQAADLIQRYGKQDAAARLLVLAEKIREEAVRQERNRIAREFHDNLAQSLTGIIVQLEVAEESLDDTDAGKRTRRALELARKALRETRRSLRDLRPELLENEGLTNAITHVSEELTKNTSLQVQTSFSGAIRQLPSAIETALLRICQEALTNIVGHADARQAKIELCFGADNVDLRVIDDGRGFEPEPCKESCGLLFMTERAKELGGTCSIQNQPGQGTQIHASIPIVPAIHFVKGAKPWVKAASA
jgi:signal transduction histidine kinase